MTPKRLLIQYAPFVYSIPLLLVMWELSSVYLVSSSMMPGLSTIFQAFVRDVKNGVLIDHTWVTFVRTISGYTLAVVVGIPMGIAMARNKVFELLVEPVFFVGYPVPKIALFPVFVFIFGIGTLSKVAFVFLECLYPITTASYFAFRNLDTKLVWAARNMGASKRRIFFTVMIPAAGPGIFSGLRVALPIAIVVVILTEMIGDSRGLGYYLTIGGAMFRYENIYAGIAAIGLFGFLSDRVIHVIRQKVIFWDGFEGVKEK